MNYIIGIISFIGGIFLFFYLLIVLNDANMRKDIISRVVRRNKGIIWNPLKIGFLVYDEKNKTDSIKLIQFINYSVGSFIYQFILHIQLKFKDVDREVKRYIKLKSKYETGIYCEHCKGRGVCRCLECRVVANKTSSTNTQPTGPFPEYRPGTCKYCSGERK